VDESDLVGGNAADRELLANIVVDVEIPVALGGGQVAEDKLG